MEIKDSLIIILIVSIAIVLGINTTPQSIVGVACPEYKTNIEPGSIALSGSWISVDCDGDGTYEGYGYSGQVSSLSNRMVTGHISEIGKDYYCFSSASGVSVYIYQNTNSATSWVYKQGVGASANADLSCDTQDDDIPTDSCGCFVDSNCDNVVNRAELGDAITYYIGG